MRRFWIFKFHNNLPKISFKFFWKGSNHKKLYLILLSITIGNTSQQYLKIIHNVEPVHICFKRRRYKNWLVNVINIYMPTSNNSNLKKKKIWTLLLSFTVLHPQIKIEILCSLFRLLPKIPFSFSYIIYQEVVLLVTEWW